VKPKPPQKSLLEISDLEPVPEPEPEEKPKIALKCWAPHKFGGWEGVPESALNPNFKNDSSDVFNLNKPMNVRKMEPNSPRRDYRDAYRAKYEQPTEAKFKQGQPGFQN